MVDDGGWTSQGTFAKNAHRGAGGIVRGKQFKLTEWVALGVKQLNEEISIRNCLSIEIPYSIVLCNYMNRENGQNLLRCWM